MLFLLGGAVGGMFLPALIGKVVGYGTGSYEDYFFIWMVTVPAAALLSAVFAWRTLR